MRAVIIREPGGPQVLVPSERPTPSPGPGEVLIRVAAAGVNRPDVLQRQGHYAPPPGTTDIPGLEVAGVIEQVGPGVERWRTGDRVCALLAGGGYAEYAVAPAVQCLPVPEGLSLPEAAALPEVIFTVWANVFERGRLQAGETLLVHGGSSGIGTAAIQLAHAHGATVITTAGSDDKCRACEALGAALAINYRTTDFVAAAKAHTGGRGVDLVLDMVGGEYLQRNIDVLAPDGRLVQIGQLGGPRSTINTIPILTKRLTLTGSTLRSRPVEEKGRLARAVEAQVWPLIAGGQVRVPIHQTFGLEQAAEAHRVMESSTHVGKLVLLVQSPGL